MKVIAAIPTRGVLLTETLESVQRNLHDARVSFNNIQTDIVLSWDKPIPDGHNEVVKKAVEKHAIYIWMVEEDVIVPDGTLRMMLKKKSMYVAADLPEKSDKRRSYIARWPVNDPVYKIYWTHLGCTLIKREVFEKIPYPWFENNHQYEVDTSQGANLSFRKLDKPHDYGGHDMLFGKKLMEAGYTLDEVKLAAIHCRIHWNNGTGNDGRHRIEKFEGIGRSSALYDVAEDFLTAGIPLKQEDFDKP